MDSDITHRFSALQHRSKEEMAYLELHAAIVSGALKPGERLFAKELATRFHVSPMPVRQALIRLEHDSLVLRNPNGSLTVAPLSTQDVEEIYPPLALLEGFAARLAAPRLLPADLDALETMVVEMEAILATGDVEALLETNARFHFTIYRAAGNKRLYDLVKGLWQAAERYRHLCYAAPGVPEQTLREHRTILAALRGGNVDEVERLVRAATEETARVLLTVMKESFSEGQRVPSLNKVPEVMRQGSA